MKHSDSITKLAAARVKAQEGFPLAQADQKNDHFGNEFAGLSSLQRSALAHLAKHGLTVIQAPSTDPENGHLVMETMLLHESGEFLSSEIALKPERPGSQAISSCSTYGQRLGLRAMVQIIVGDEIDGGVSDHVDDDAEAADHGPAKPVPVTKRARKKTRKDFDSFETYREYAFGEMHFSDNEKRHFIDEHGQLAESDQRDALKAIFTQNLKRAAAIKPATTHGMTEPQPKRNTRKVKIDNESALFGG